MTSTLGLVLGVDVGGTKTHACLASTDGKVLGFGVSGSGNWEGVGIDGTTSVIRMAVTEALDQAGAQTRDVAAAAVCLAGYDWPSDEQRLRPVVDHLGLGCRAVLRNDSFGALRAGTDHPYGIVNNAGTGGVTAGRNKSGRVFRTMAEGIGEGNGSADLSFGALELVAREVHGQIAPTLLTPAILRFTGFDSALDMFESYMRGHGTVRGDFARLALDVAEAGDEAALDLTRRVAMSHARDVLGVATMLEMLGDEADIVMAGSVHQRGCKPWVSAFTSAVTEHMPSANFRVLDGPPVAGCVLLAAESLDVDSESIAADIRRGAAQFLDSRQ